MNPISFFRMLSTCIVASASILSVYAQGLPPGGLPPTISIVPVSGMDEVTIIGPTGSAHWTHNWTEVKWRKNGVLLNAMPPSPAHHEISNSPEIFMTSSGTQKLTVQWNEAPIPSEVGVRIFSKALCEFNANFAGSVSASNGLGDAMAQSSQFLDGEGTPIQEFSSEGWHFRIIKLNQNGYGELTFTSSATVSQSGNGAKVWASAQNANKSFDSRSIDLQGVYTPLFKIGPLSSPTVQITYTYSNGHQVFRDFASIHSEPMEVEKYSSALYTVELDGPIGISRGQSVGNSYYVHGGTESDLESVGYTGLSSFALINMYNGHGTFNWQFSETPWPLSPLSGTLPNDYEVISSSGFWLHHPHNCVEYLDGAFSGHHLNAVGNDVGVNYKVRWNDGVLGEVRYNLQIKDKAESILKTDFQKFANNNTTGTPERPYHAMDPLLDENVINGWIDGAIVSHDFINQGTPVVARFIANNIESTSYLGIFGNFLSEIPHVGPYIESMANLLAFVAGNVPENTTELVSRTGANKLGIYSNVSGVDHWAEFLNDPNGYRWRLYAEETAWVAAESCFLYGSNGFTGSTVVPVVHKGSDKIVDHWIDIRFWISSGGGE